ncbi:MAG: hypothetical protein ABT940_02385 [Alphaproteobacteria bacterium]
MSRVGNRPDRRFVVAGSIAPDVLRALARRVRYDGSALHKLHPGNYGFVPPINPRPSKSVCDDVRDLLLEEVKKLFLHGIELGMVSRFPDGGVPKYVWAVDDAGEVFEAKTKSGHEVEYHGYRLGDDERQMRTYILEEWKRRCPTS